ncbi:MAG: class I SAM-dependent methyltransferase [Planctomycetota bacterium]
MTDHKSLERIVPDRIEQSEHTGRETLDLHLERYRFAASHAHPGRALDCACGVGYGTRILADEGRGVVEALGVDIDASAIDYARERYASPSATFLRSNLLELEVTGSFETVVSLETIEHLPEPEPFVARLVELLAPGGVLVASVPTTPSVDLNPHHLHDFTRASFLALLDRNGLSPVDELVQVQNVSPVAVLRRSEKRMSEMRKGLVGWYVRHPDALVRRVTATLRHGFVNKYSTFACIRSGDRG